MSTISITTPAFQSAQVRTTLRLTVRGRRLLLALASVPLAAGIAFAAVSGGAALASSSGASVPAATVTVQSGDTFWGIAEEIAPDVDPREVIRELQALNGLRSSVLPVGFTLTIPEEYAAAE